MLIQSTYSLKILACCYPVKFGGCREYRGRPDGLLNGDSICCSIVRGNFCGCSRRSLEMMFHNALFNNHISLRRELRTALRRKPGVLPDSWGLSICRPINWPKPTISARGRYFRLVDRPRAGIIGFGQFIGLQMDSALMSVSLS